jgi:hypothetical protein
MTSLLMMIFLQLYTEVRMRHVRCTLHASNDARLHALLSALTLV